MRAKTKIVTVGVLILLGAALFYYCAVFYPRESAAQAKTASPAVSAAELQPLEQTPSPASSSASSSLEDRPRPSAGAT